MAEKTNAKKKVGTATRKFDKILKSVKDRMTQNKEHSTGFLESISCDLSNTHADVEEKLESYRELLDSDDEDDKPEVERTDAELDKLRKDLTEVQILLENLKVKEANSKKDKLKINAKKKVGTATRKYHKVLKAVKEKMSQNKEHSSGFLESLTAEISSAYAEAEMKLEEYRELLDSGDEDDDS
jgi:gas vesicle protein